MKYNKKYSFVGCKKGNVEKINIVGLPFDGTETFRKGTAKGPDYIRKYSDSIETFSYFQKKDITELPVSDTGNLIFKNKSPENIINEIQIETQFYIDNKKIPLFIGGEHLVTYPVVKAYANFYKKLNVLYFDAHADFRDNYNGNKLSHAAVARRIFEMISEKNLFMFGIRSFEKNEYDYMKLKNIFFDTEFKNFEMVINKIKNFPVYVTIDMDVFDPSCMQGVGNPEAGGIDFNFFMNKIITGLDKLNNILAIDVVEYAPPYDPSGASGIFTAKIIRELLFVLNKNVQKR